MLQTGLDEKIIERDSLNSSIVENMKFASLGSGSAGNCTVIVAGENVVLVDCGFGVRETERRLQKIGLCANQVTAIIVTHEHTDHIKGVPALNRKYHMPVYMTRGTFLAREYGIMPNVVLIDNFEPFVLGALSVEPVAVPHDAKEPAQFVFCYQSHRLGVLTDLGFITPHVIDAFSGCDALLIEANHDLTMLSMGPYPASLKSRVSSNYGHLNNHQAAELLDSICLKRLRHLVVGHISIKNNTQDLAQQAISPMLSHLNDLNVLYACQDEGFDWLYL